MPAPHRSVFTGRMPFLLPDQQHQSTEGSQALTILTTILEQHEQYIITPKPLTSTVQHQTDIIYQTESTNFGLSARRAV